MRAGATGNERIECFVVLQSLNASGISVTHCVCVFLIDELAPSDFFYWTVKAFCLGLSFNLKIEDSVDVDVVVLFFFPSLLTFVDLS